MSSFVNVFYDYFLYFSQKKKKKINKQLNSLKTLEIIFPFILHHYRQKLLDKYIS